MSIVQAAMNVHAGIGRASANRAELVAFGERHPVITPVAPAS